MEAYHNQKIYSCSINCHEVMDLRKGVCLEGALLDKNSGEDTGKIIGLKIVNADEDCGIELDGFAFEYSSRIDVGIMEDVSFNSLIRNGKTLYDLGESKLSINLLNFRK